MEPPTNRPGLATERTALAWTRTALVAAVLAAMLGHAGATQAGVAAVIAWLVAGCAVLFAVAVWWQGARMYERSRQRLADGEPVARPTALLAVSACVVALAIGVVIVASL